MKQIDSMNAGHDVLLIVDAQPDRLDATMTRSAERFSAAIGALVQAARLHGVPVVTTAGALGEHRAPVVASVADGPIVWRSTVDAFASPAFAEAVERSGRRSVVVAGAASDIGVAAAVRSAVARGYRACWVPDACSATSALAELATLISLASEGIAAVSAGAVIAGWQADFAAAGGAQTLDLLRLSR